MSQSRKASLAESLANIVVGILIQGAGQAGLFYFMHLDISVKQFTTFTLVMTVLSIVRSYCLRRLWNAEWWKRKKNPWAGRDAYLEELKKEDSLATRKGWLAGDWELVECEDEGCPHYGTPHGHSKVHT